jgi:Flp pilus assembly CpaE family ATPase
MSLPIVTAADGGGWEATLLARLAVPGASLAVVRRCVDVMELAAVAASGQVVAALVDARLRRLDADLVGRVAAAGVVVVGVLGPDATADTERLRAAGIAFAVAADAEPAVFADVVQQALAELATTTGPAAGYADPSGLPSGLPAAEGAEPAGTLAATSRPGNPARGLDTGAGLGAVAEFGASAGASLDAADSAGAADSGDATDSAGAADSGDAAASAGASARTIAVWGPTGAPGRTTVAVNLAHEIARLGVRCLLVDADLYGGVVANVLGLLDESPGLVAACRQAQANRLDSAALAALCWQLEPALRVLTGVARAERWPEVRPSALQQVLALSHQLAECTVLDLGFCLETDEELSFDTIAPRRNGATLAALEVADLVLAVGSADPVGMQRLIRGLDELTALRLSAPVWVVLNRVRADSVAGKPEAELDAALQRFAGRSPAAFLPYDRAALDRALVAGKVLAEVSGSSPLRTALVELAAAACGRAVPPRGRRRSRSGRATRR